MSNSSSLPLNNTPVDLAPEHLQTVRSILQQFIPEETVAVFGSRAQGRAKPTSDLDLVIMNDMPLASGKLSALRDAFSGSHLPMKVDIVEWANTEESFRKIIEENNVKM